MRPDGGAGAPIFLTGPWCSNRRRPAPPWAGAPLGGAAERGQLSRTNPPAPTASSPQPTTAGQADNRQHHGSFRIRDVTHGEDASQIRTGNSAQRCSTWPPGRESAVFGAIPHLYQLSLAEQDLGQARNAG